MILYSTTSYHMYLKKTSKKATKNKPNVFQ